MKKENKNNEKENKIIDKQIDIKRLYKMII